MQTRRNFLGSLGRLTGPMVSSTLACGVLAVLWRVCSEIVIVALVSDLGWLALFLALKGFVLSLAIAVAP